MSKRARPGRSERKKGVTPMNEQVIRYPHLSSSIQALMEKLHGQDPVTLLYRTAKSQEEVDKACTVVILLLSELIGGNLIISREIIEGVSFVTEINMKEETMKEETMNEQTAPEAEQPDQTTETTQTGAGADHPVNDGEETTSEAEPVVEEPSVTPVAELWEKLHELSQKDDLPDLNGVRYTDTSILNQIRMLWKQFRTGELDNRFLMFGEHRMADMVAKISDPELMDMIPYVEHLSGQMGQKSSTPYMANVEFDFGVYGNIRFTAERYEPLNHEASLSGYMSVMTMAWGEQDDNSIYSWIYKDAQPGVIKDHKIFASHINRARLIHHLYSLYKGSSVK